MGQLARFKRLLWLLLVLRGPGATAQMELVSVVGDFLRRAIKFYCADDFMLCPNGGKTWRSWNNNVCQFTPCEFVAPNDTLLALVRTNDSLFHLARPSSWFGKTDFVVSAPNSKLVETAHAIDRETVRMWQWKKNRTSRTRLDPEMWLALDVYFVNDRAPRENRKWSEWTTGSSTTMTTSDTATAILPVKGTGDQASDAMTEQEFQLLHSSAPAPSSSVSLFSFPSVMTQYLNYSRFVDSVKVSEWLLDHIEQNEITTKMEKAVTKLPSLVLGADRLDDLEHTNVSWLLNQNTTVQVEFWQFIRDFVYKLATVNFAALDAGLSLEQALSFPLHPETISLQVFMTNFADVLHWRSVTRVMNVTRVLCEQIQVPLHEVNGTMVTSRDLDMVWDCSCWVLVECTAESRSSSSVMETLGVRFCDEVARPRSSKSKKPQ